MPGMHTIRGNLYFLVSSKVENKCTPPCENPVSLLHFDAAGRAFVALSYTKMQGCNDFLIY